VKHIRMLLLLFLIGSTFGVVASIILPYGVAAGQMGPCTDCIGTAECMTAPANCSPRCDPGELAWVTPTGDGDFCDPCSPTCVCVSSCEGGG
jgi:hypothetical protein